MKALRSYGAPDALRRKLMLGLPGSLALISPLSLIACGGSDYAPATADAPAGSTLPAIDRSVVTLKLALPAGTGASLKDSRLMTGNNVSQVAADGTAGAVLLRGEPQMSYLIGADGRLLLMGAVEAGRTVLNSRTTAEALIYIASEVALLEPALQIALRTVLQTHAVVEPVRVAVEAALLRGGISDQDAELMAALVAAEAVVRRRTPATAASAAQRAHALKVSIDPADLISGVRVKHDAAFNTVVFQNTFRRRAYAWVEQVGYFDSTGAKTDLPGPSPIKDFDISATTALSFDNLVIRVGDFLAGLAADIGLIGDYQEGTLPFIATDSIPVYLPISPDNAQSSLYRTRVIGLGATPAEGLTPKESDKLDTLLVATVWEDIFVPIMQTLVLPLISDRLGKAFQAEVKTLFLATIGIDTLSVAFLTSLLPNTWDRVKKGKASDAFGAFWKEFFTSNTFQDLMKNSLNSLIIASVGADQPGATVVDGAGNLVAVNLLATEDLQGKVAQFQASLGKVAKIIAIVKAAATVADFAAMTLDWSRSEQRSVFALASSGTTIAFTPAAVAAMPGQSAPLTAVLGETADLGAGSVIRYDWTLSGSAGGTLRNPANQSTGTKISTSTNTVDYVSAAGAAPGATDQVDVKAVLTDIGTSGGGVIAVAQVPAVVTISAVRLTPASVDFKLEAGQRQDFSVEFATGFGSSGLVYEWTCPSVFGFISDNAQLSSSATPTFRSALPKVVYASGAVAVGGEIEIVKVRVLRITSAPGDVTETTETVATLDARVRYGVIELTMSPAKPMDVPTDTRFGLSASVKTPLPQGGTVTWSWTISGPASMENQTSFNGGEGCAIDVVTGSAEGTVNVSVRATVVVPGSPPTTIVTDPVGATLNVKKGLKTITLEASAGVFACTDPKACGVSAYTAFIVPSFAKATDYVAELSGFAYPGCNRFVKWPAKPKGDGGDCDFPVTYHPHTSAGATNQWAIWIGFGGAPSGGEKCVVTVTLGP